MIQNSNEIIICSNKNNYSVCLFDCFTVHCRFRKKHLYRKHSLRWQTWV